MTKYKVLNAVTGEPKKFGFVTEQDAFNYLHSIEDQNESLKGHHIVENYSNHPF
jgi:hypothetical protein